MSDEVKAAYEWAKEQDYPSVAARYAKLLAEEIDNLKAEHERTDITLRNNNRRIIDDVYSSLGRVIDECTRLLTEVGCYKNGKFEVWEVPKFQGLEYPAGEYVERHRKSAEDDSYGK